MAVATLLLPITVAAHAELVSAEPADSSSVEGPFFAIILTFSQPLADGSRAEVFQTGQSTPVLTIPPDTADPTRMTYAPGSQAQQFSAGDYTIQWTSVADDGDILRGTIAFTVTAPPPTPRPTPTPEPSATPVPATPTPLPTAAPTPAPTPAPTAPPVDGSGDGNANAVIVPIVVGLVLVGLAAWWLVRRRPSAS